MAKYIKQEMPDLNRDGNNKCYYRMKNSGNVSTRELIHKICFHGGVGLSESAIEHALCELINEMAYQLADGHTVTLDGLGTFQATIDIVKGKEMDSMDEEGHKLNAASLELNGVNYRADKKLIRQARKHCTLEKDGECRVNRTPFSKEERLQMALAYLADPEHPTMGVTDYAEMTKLPKSTAAKELRAFASSPGQGIKSVGRGTHTVYVPDRG